MTPIHLYTCTVAAMGLCASSASKTSQDQDDVSRSMSVSESDARSKHKTGYSTLNQHTVLSDIKIHSVVSKDLDSNHATAMRIPLGEVTDEQLLAEVARRNLDLHDKITDAVVKETYTFGKVLGSGSSGDVYLVTNKTNNIKMACKIVKKNSKINDMESMSTEIEIMKRIRHRNVVSMYELYETPSCLWIVLELVDGGDLLSYLSGLPYYTEMTVAIYFKQILQGVHYLHGCGVVHRDLKLDNILLSDSIGGEIKVADFGLSALVRLGEKGYDPEESNKRKQYRSLSDMWGTREYFAPEVIKCKYGPQADVWALGCLLYELLVGRQTFPYMNNDTDETFFARIDRCEYTQNSVPFKQLSSEAKDLISKLLVSDPVLRYSASEALQHPWIKTVVIPRKTVTDTGTHEAHVLNLDESDTHHTAKHLDEAHEVLKTRYSNREAKIKKKKVPQMMSIKVHAPGHVDL